MFIGWLLGPLLGGLRCCIGHHLSESGTNHDIAVPLVLGLHVLLKDLLGLAAACV